MALDREAIAVALLARMRAKVTGAKKCTRKLVDYDNVQPEQQPTLEVVFDSQDPNNQQGCPPKWVISAWVVIYATSVSDDPDFTPETPLNALVKQVEAALEIQDDEQPMSDAFPHATTLGGRVEYCWISGAVDYAQGNDGGQAWAKVPLEMAAISKRG